MFPAAHQEDALALAQGGHILQLQETTARNCWQELDLCILLMCSSLILNDFSIYENDY